jgi:hypothetical protein
MGIWGTIHMFSHIASKRCQNIQQKRQSQLKYLQVTMVPNIPMRHLHDMLQQLSILDYLEDKQKRSTMESSFQPAQFLCSTVSNLLIHFLAQLLIQFMLSHFAMIGINGCSWSKYTVLIKVAAASEIGVAGNHEFSYVYILPDALLLGYCVAQVHAIFSITKQVTVTLFPTGTQLEQHFAYVEWFTKFPHLPSLSHQTYKVSGEIAARDRVASIIPISLI